MKNILFRNIICDRENEIASLLCEAIFCIINKAKVEAKFQRSKLCVDSLILIQGDETAI